MRQLCAVSQLKFYSCAYSIINTSVVTFSVCVQLQGSAVMCGLKKMSSRDVSDEFLLRALYPSVLW